MKPRTLYDKIWDDHVVEAKPDGTTLLVRHAIPDGDEYIPVATTFAAAWPRALGRLAGHLTPNTWDPT